MTSIRSLVATSFAILASLVSPSFAQAADEGDHPLVSRYPGSEIKNRTSKDFERYTLVIGLDPKTMEFRGKGLEGKVVRIVYANPKERSTLEIFRNYRDALEKAGGEILYSCEENACGPAYARSAWNRFNGLFAASDGDPRYLAARVTKGDVDAYVGVMVGKQRTQLDVVEVKAMDEGLVAVAPDALAKSIASEGVARVYGIHFDVDKASIRRESKPALDAIAEVLEKQPKLAIFVVGHTDATGGLDHNLELSRARARSVVAALTGDYRRGGPSRRAWRRSPRARSDQHHRGRKAAQPARRARRAVSTKERHQRTKDWDKHEFVSLPLLNLFGV